MDHSPNGDVRSQPGLIRLLGDAVGGTAVVAGTGPKSRASAAVMVDEVIGAVTTQRISLRAQPEGLALCTWPAELKPQAEALYQAGRVTRLVKFFAEDQQPWQATPNVHC